MLSIIRTRYSLKLNYTQQEGRQDICVKGEVFFDNPCQKTRSRQERFEPMPMIAFVNGLIHIHIHKRLYARVLFIFDRISRIFVRSTDLVSLFERVR